MMWKGHTKVRCCCSCCRAESATAPSFQASAGHHC
jgi:hypothetical protein